jgi:hypothetical protein
MSPCARSHPGPHRPRAARPDARSTDRRPPKHRRRRDRRPQAGQMILWDGSRHDWLEERGPLRGGATASLDSYGLELRDARGEVRKTSGTRDHDNPRRPFRSGAHRPAAPDPRGSGRPPAGRWRAWRRLGGHCHTSCLAESWQRCCTRGFVRSWRTQTGGAAGPARSPARACLHRAAATSPRPCAMRCGGAMAGSAVHRQHRSPLHLPPPTPGSSPARLRSGWTAARREPRSRCRAHNLHAAEQDYGPEHIAARIAARQARARSTPTPPLSV